MRGITIRLYNAEYEVLLGQYISPQQRARSAIYTLWNIYTSFPDVLETKFFRVYLSDELYGMLYDMTSGSTKRGMSSVIKAALLLYSDVKLLNFYKKKLDDLRGWR